MKTTGLSSRRMRVGSAHHYRNVDRQEGSQGGRKLFTLTVNLKEGQTWQPATGSSFNSGASHDLRRRCENGDDARFEPLRRRHRRLLVFSACPNALSISAEIYDVPRHILMRSEALVLQDDTQKGLVDLQPLQVGAVVDEALLPEFVHEQVDPCAGRANHLRQRFL
jgi:hypothetical protein